MKRNFRYLIDKHNIAGAREEFEKLCEAVLKKEYQTSDVHGVKVSKGDGGIDVFIGDINISMDVYQCKFFIDGIGSSQKTQIKNSFKKVMSEYGGVINHWVLCIPCELTKENYEWWYSYKLKKEIEYSISLNILTENDLIALLKKYNLYDEYFGLIRVDSNMINNRLEEVENDFCEVINLVSEIPYKVHLDELEEINRVVRKYKVKKYFMTSSIIVDLESLVMLIVITSGDIVKEKKETEYEKIAISILKEYYNIIKSPFLA